MKKIPSDMIAGVTHRTNSHGLLSIVSYCGWRNVRVRFKDTGYETVTDSSGIRLGSVKDKTKPFVFGVGYIGDGNYKSRSNGDLTKSYQLWHNMLQRCYNPKFQELEKSYIGCSVCSEWHNFQVFAKWFDDNHTNGYQLDKDILLKGNRVYSPDACIFTTAQKNSEEANAKTYKITSPLGVKFTVTNLSKFCADNGLTKSAMYNVCSGKNNHHKGWTTSKRP